MPRLPLSFCRICVGLLLGFSAWGFSSVSCDASPLITEFMASNKTTLADEDGDFSDWIEIYNPDLVAADLSGWYLSDNASKKTKWQFPTGVILPPNGYLVVFASNKNRRDPTRQLHTSFALGASGEYLGLIEPDGVTPSSEYAPIFPAQLTDVSYGLSLDANGVVVAVGYLARPSPGAAGGDIAAAALTDAVTFSRPSGPFGDAFNFTLAGATGDEVIRYEFASPSALGLDGPIPTAKSPAYTGPIDVKNSAFIQAAVFSADGKRRGPLASVNYVQLANSMLTFASALPLVVLENNGAGPLVADKLDHSGWIHLLSSPSGGNTSLLTPPVASSPMSFNIRGDSSALFPKKSFSVELHDALGGGAPQSLLGIPSGEDWALVGPWYYDQTYIKNAFVYSLSNRMGRWAPHTRFVELFVHPDDQPLSFDHYTGISVLTERIKIGPDRVNITPLAVSDVTGPAVTGGYILKLDDPDADHFSWATNRNFPDFPSTGTAVVVAEPKASNLAQAQRDYIQGYVQSMEDSLYSDRDSGWANRTYLNSIDLSSWVDCHLINLLVGNSDAVTRSFYFSKDRNGKLVAGPVWDFDRSLGSPDTRNNNPAAWVSNNLLDPWNYGWYGVMARDPEFMQAWIDRWQNLRQNELTTGNLVALVDSLAAQIPADAAARDAALYPDNAGRFSNGWSGELAFLKNWLSQRADWIDHQFVAPPAITSTDGHTFTITPADGVQLVYTFDGSDPRTVGGGLSASATVSSSPVTVDDSAHVKVRAFRAADANHFPGGPWSSSTTLDTIKAASRIVNLSSRGMAGVGDGTLILGMVVQSQGSQRFLIRGVGPGLAQFGISNSLSDPILRVVNGSGQEIARNQGWFADPASDGTATAARDVGAFDLSTDSLDSALVVQLPPGVYTILVASASGRSGIALAELYQLDEGSRAINLSTRTIVRAGEGLLIGGIVVHGDSPKKFLFRAVGPGLAALNVPGFLPDPVLTVLSQQTVIGTNDDWDGSDATILTSTAVGAFPLTPGSKDSALILTLDPGNYTLQVTGKNNTQGVALVEVYEVP